MDDADRAQETIEIIWANRSHCRDCGETLEAHRRPYGRCIDCARDAERRGELGHHG
jgi:hypothetical protein